MSDMKAARHFVVEDYEAEIDDGGPVKLHMTIRVETPAGYTEDYNLLDVLQSVFGEYQIVVNEVKAP